MSLGQSTIRADFEFDTYGNANDELKVQIPQKNVDQQQVYVSAPCKVEIQETQDGYLTVKSKFANSSQTQVIQVTIYGNESQNKYMNTWRINAHTCETFQVFLHQGQQSQHTFNLKTDLDRVVKIYSSNPKVIWFEGVYSRPFLMKAQNKNNILFHAFQEDEQSQTVIIHVQDVNSNELLQGLIVKTQLQIEKIISIIDVKQPKIKDKLLNFSYTNTGNQINVFRMFCSKSSYITVLDEEQKLKPKENTIFRIIIKKCDHYFNREIKLFIEEQTKKKLECFLLRIQDE